MSELYAQGGVIPGNGELTYYKPQENECMFHPDGRVSRWEAFDGGLRLVPFGTWREVEE